jgi:hypothetical protein
VTRASIRRPIARELGHELPADVFHAARVATG